MSEFPQYTEEQEKKQGAGKGARGAAKLGEEPVSYTHLTLPTIATV